MIIRSIGPVTSSEVKFWNCRWTATWRHLVRSLFKLALSFTEISRPVALGHFPVTGQLMEASSSFKTNLGEPGLKRRKGDKTSQLNDAFETVTSQEDSRNRQYLRNSAYDNNNVIVDEQAKRLVLKQHFTLGGLLCDWSWKSHVTQCYMFRGNRAGIWIIRNLGSVTPPLIVDDIEIIKIKSLSYSQIIKENGSSQPNVGWHPRFRCNCRHCDSCTKQSFSMR